MYNTFVLCHLNQKIGCLLCYCLLHVVNYTCNNHTFYWMSMAQIVNKVGVFIYTSNTTVKKSLQSLLERRLKTPRTNFLSSKHNNIIWSKCFNIQFTTNLWDGFYIYTHIHNIHTYINIHLVIFYGYNSIYINNVYSEWIGKFVMFDGYIGVNTNVMALKFFTYILGSIAGVRQTIEWWYIPIEYVWLMCILFNRMLDWFNYANEIILVLIVFI